MKKEILKLITYAVLGIIPTSASMTNSQMQAILNRGEDLLLEKGEVYEISEPLRFVKQGQRIRTKNARHLSDYATLGIAHSGVGQIINGNHVSNIILENVILDGNRYEFSSLPSEVDDRALVFMGGGTSRNQIVRRCVFLSPRTWSALEVHVGGRAIKVVSNIFLNAGCDVRGNGREETENPRVHGVKWGDAISCGARNSTIQNNIILDPTDVGIVLYGAPGTKVIGNVVATISRESLGGINLVDPVSFWTINGNPKRIDYRGVEVSHNLIDAKGGRIHMSIPIGATPWVPRKAGFTFVGGSVTSNTFAGGAAAYGIVATEIDGFKIINNTSTAKYSGEPDGLHRNPADSPAAFLYDPAKIGSSVLQGQFRPMRRHLQHLLRCNHGDLTPQGYKYYNYGDHEVNAVVTTAYLEMIQRRPNLNELRRHMRWIQETRGNSDQLRKALMLSSDFISLYGTENIIDLQHFRSKLWFEAISEAIGPIAPGIAWPPARVIYNKSWRKISTGL